MENPLLQNELQDICSFRQTILNSNQKIQHQLLRRKNPIQLVQYCDCSNQKNYDNPLIKCSYDDKTTDYFSEIDYPHSNNFIQLPQNFKDPYLDDYLNQYEQNSFGFMLQPQRQRENLQNHSHQYITPVSSRKRVPLKPVNISQFQNIHLPFKQSNLKKSKDQRNFLNNTLNPNKIVYDDPSQLKRSYMRSKISQNKKMNLLNSTENIRVSQSQRKLLRTSNKEDRPFTSRKELKMKLSNCYKNKKSNKKNANKKVQNTDLNQISLRIKKRIQLSLVVNKSTEDSYLAVYKKQLRERSEILDKIMSLQKEMEKIKKRAASVRK